MSRPKKTSLTSNPDFVNDFGGFVGGDLAGVVAGVFGLGQRDDQVVAVGHLLQSESVRFADDLSVHRDDFFALLPQQHESLWKLLIK